MISRRLIILDKEIDLTNSYINKSIAAKLELTLEVRNLLRKKEHNHCIAVFSAKGCLLPRVSDWLTKSFKSESLSTATIINYGINLSYFVDYLNRHKLFNEYEVDSALMYVEEHHFREYFTHLENDKGLSSSTIRNREGAFTSLFNSYLTKKRARPFALRNDNPFENGLMSKPPKNKLVELLPVNQLIDVLNLLKRESERAVIHFMYDSGLRVSEVPRFTKQDLDEALAHQTGTIIDDHSYVQASTYKPLFVAGSKGRRNEIKPRHTFVSTATLQRVKRYVSSPAYRKHYKFNSKDNPVFLNAYGKPWTTATLKKMLGRLSKKALSRGITNKKIHPHKLRHSFAVGFLQSNDLGTDAAHRLHLLKGALGHQFLETTNIYTAIPADLYCKYLDESGCMLHRHELMEVIWEKTKSTKNAKA